MTFCCLKCQKIYPYIQDDSWSVVMCPKIGCNNGLVEIDELIVPTIFILNTKGYYTTFCCAGHSYEEDTNTYIAFHDEVDLPNYPIGFSKCTMYSNVIRKKYKITDSSILDELHLSIIYTNIELLNWATNLPMNPRKKDISKLIGNKSNRLIIDENAFKGDNEW